MRGRPSFRRSAPTKADKRATAAAICAHRKGCGLPPLPVETLMHCYGLSLAEAEGMNGGEAGNG